MCPDTRGMKISRKLVLALCHIVFDYFRLLGYLTFEYQIKESYYFNHA